MAISKKVAMTTILVYLNLAMFGVLSLGQEFNLSICADQSDETAKEICCYLAKLHFQIRGPSSASNDLCLGLQMAKGTWEATPEIRQLFENVKVMCELPGLDREVTFCGDFDANRQHLGYMKAEARALKGSQINPIINMKK